MDHLHFPPHLSGQHSQAMNISNSRREPHHERSSDPGKSGSKRTPLPFEFRHSPNESLSESSHRSVAVHDVEKAVHYSEDQALATITRKMDTILQELDTMKKAFARAETAHGENITPALTSLRDFFAGGVSTSRYSLTPQLIVTCDGKRTAFSRQKLKLLSYQRASDLFVDAFVDEDRRPSTPQGWFAPPPPRAELVDNIEDLHVVISWDD